MSLQLLDHQSYPGGLVVLDYPEVLEHPEDLEILEIL
jgi:hypothetical protein